MTHPADERTREQLAAENEQLRSRLAALEAKIKSHQAHSDAAARLKQAEEKIAHFTSFPQLNPNPVIELDSRGNITFCNEGAINALKKLGAKEDASLFLPNDISEIVNALKHEGEPPAFYREVAIEDRLYAESILLSKKLSAIRIYSIDITERKRAEEALKKAKDELEVRVHNRTAELKKTVDALSYERQRFNDVLDALPAYVVLLAPDYHVPFANKFFRERFGESGGKRCFEYLFHRTEPCDVCETYKVLKTNAPLQWDWTGPDGRNYSIFDFPFTDADGSALIMEVGLDVTDQKQAEEQIRKLNAGLEQKVLERTAELSKANEQLLGEIVEREQAEEALRQSREDLSHAQAVVIAGNWRLDVNRNELTWSEENHRIFGVPPGTPMTYEFFLSTVHPDDREYVDRMWSAALRGEPYDIEHRIIVDGKVKWVREKAELEFDEQGKLLGGFGITQDITARKQAEEATLRAKEEWERTFNSVPDLIAVLDNTHRIVRVNRPMARRLGLAPEQCVGLPCYRAVHGTDSPPSFCPHALTVADGREHTAELHEDRLGGDFLVSTTPLTDQTGRLFGSVHVARDITARKQMEHSLREAMEAAESARISAEQAKEIAVAASNAKSQFLAVLSHELRTPLTPVVAAVSMLLKDPRFDAENRDVLEMILRNAKLEAHLIDDLLDVTRIEQGKVVLDRKHIDLHGVVRKALEVCMPDVDSRQLKVSIDAPDGPFFVDADESRLQQVFWNLIKNSVKFTPPGGSIAIRCRREGDGHVVAEVADTGKGIKSNLMPRLFSAFEQGDKKAARQFGGLGLGLAISKAIVEMHGGTISVQSEGENRGATFAVKLPLPPTETGAPRACKPRTTSAHRAAPPRALRILLVEDHAHTAKLVARLLQGEGHTVETAADLASALRLASEKKPGHFDILISDLGLPDGSGLDLIRALRAKGLNMPAIALSGYGHESEKKQSRRAGFAEHLVKPDDVSRLADTVARLAAGATPSPK